MFSKKSSTKTAQTHDKKIQKHRKTERQKHKNTETQKHKHANAPEPFKERFWLRVLGRLTDAADSFLGEVANELLLPGAPPSGALIEFRPAHILSISDARAMEPLPERETPDNIRHVFTLTRRPP